MTNIFEKLLGIKEKDPEAYAEHMNSIAKVEQEKEEGVKIDKKILEETKENINLN